MTALVRRWAMLVFVTDDGIANSGGTKFISKREIVATLKRADFPAGVKVEVVDPAYSDLEVKTVKASTLRKAYSRVMRGAGHGATNPS